MKWVESFIRWERVGFLGKQMPQFVLCIYRKSSRAKTYLTIIVSLKLSFEWQEMNNDMGRDSKFLEGKM